MPILPMSCSGAARRMTSTIVSGNPIVAAIRAEISPTRAVCWRVSSSRNSAASARRLEDFMLRGLQLLTALLDLLFQQIVLTLQRQVQRARLQQVLDAQQHFERIERLAEEVLRAHRQRALTRDGIAVARQHHHRHIRVGGNVRLEARQNS